MIEMYAIVFGPTPPLPDMVPLSTVSAGSLLAIWAPADTPRADRETTPDDLWRYERVLEALMVDRDLLPMRFGTRLPDVAAAASVIRGRHDDFVDALQRVRGAAEIGVRVIASPGADVGPEVAIASIHAPLATIARDSRMHRRPESELLRSAYLVDRDAVEEVAGRIAERQRHTPDLQVLCTGPWPPYSFVG
jgi:hypothetical protein